VSQRESYYEPELTVADAARILTAKGFKGGSSSHLSAIRIQEIALGG
jgi:hypothetical protein